MRFAYADPPYLGMGARLYGYPEWDDKERHFELLSALREDFRDGWALSCNPADLGWLYPACLSRWEDVRVGVWAKTYHQIRVNVAVQYAWEPVIWRGGRALLGRKPLVRDWHMGTTALSDPALIGSKPPAFCRWVLDLLGFEPDEGDTLDDLFPGSGVVGRVTRDWSRQEAMLP